MENHDIQKVPPGLQPYLRDPNIVKSMKRYQKRLAKEEGGMSLSEAEKAAKRGMRECYGIEYT